MCRAIAFAVVTACVVCMSGCGGGNSSDGNGQSAFVHILDTSLTARTVNVKVGTPVRWVNSTGEPQQVISGILAPQPSGVPPRVIRVTAGGLFNPPSTPTNPIEANLGDTIQYSNDSTVSVTINVFNDNGNLVFSIPLVQGQLTDVTNQFLTVGAGLYTFRLGGVGQSGAIVLFGKPVPDTTSVNSFESPILTPGSTFTRVFTHAGTVRYYAPDLDISTRSFRTGTVNVQ